MRCMLVSWLGAEAGRLSRSQSVVKSLPATPVLQVQLLCLTRHQPHLSFQSDSAFQTQNSNQTTNEERRNHRGRRLQLYNSSTTPNPDPRSDHDHLNSVLRYRGSAITRCQPRQTKRLLRRDFNTLFLRGRGCGC